MGGAGWIGSVAEVAGYLGAGLIVVAYFLNQNGRLRSGDWRFPATNLLGSCLLLFSLWFTPNLPSVAIEAFWSLISLYGIARSRRAARAARS